MDNINWELYRQSDENDSCKYYLEDSITIRIGAFLPRYWVKKTAKQKDSHVKDIVDSTSNRFQSLLEKELENPSAGIDTIRMLLQKIINYRIEHKHVFSNNLDNLITRIIPIKEKLDQIIQQRKEQS